MCIRDSSKIVGNANVLIMPALHSAAISTKLMKVFGGGKNIGPLLIGLGQPIEVAALCKAGMIKTFAFPTIFENG